MIGDRPFTPSEMGAILKQVSASPRDHVLIQFQYGLGASVSAILALKTRDVARSITKISGYITVKGRHTCVPEHMTKALQGYFAWVAGQTITFSLDRPLFFSIDSPHKSLTAAEAHAITFKAAAACGITGAIGRHSIRKTAAEALYESSHFNIHLVRDFLGLKSVNAAGNYIGYGVARKLRETLMALGRGCQ